MTLLVTSIEQVDLEINAINRLFQDDAHRVNPLPDPP
jgi:hypothetical protein